MTLLPGKGTGIKRHAIICCAPRAPLPLVAVRNPILSRNQRERFPQLL